GIVFAALGILAWSNVREPWQLFGAALVSGTGWALTNSAAVNAIVAPWFDKQRPKALSLAFNGASCGGLLFTPLWVFLIAHFVFSHEAILIGAAMLAVMIPVLAGVGGAAPSPAAATPGAPARPPLTRAQLLGDRNFVTISAAFALALFA